MRRWRNLVPVLISVGLVAWVVWRVSVTHLAEAADRVDWMELAAATGGMVLALYFWDAVCLRWLFRQPDGELGYATTLHARGTAYLASAFNYELGQGVLAWQLARVQGMPLLSGLGRCLLLGFHDLAVLLTIGLGGALLSSDDRAPAIRIFCTAGLLGILGALVLAGRLPPRWRVRLRESRWGAWLGWWSPGRTLRLFLLRGAYYAIILVYAAISLSLCRVSLDYGVLCSVIPLVLLADGLPISVSGLGTRETALLLLLQPDGQTAGAVVTCSLIWSLGLMTGRAILGLGHLWLPRLWRTSGVRLQRSEHAQPGDRSNGICRPPHDG
jgi:hypothetical protein